MRLHLAHLGKYAEGRYGRQTASLEAQNQGLVLFDSPDLLANRSVSRLSLGLNHFRACHDQHPNGLPPPLSHQTAIDDKWRGPKGEIRRYRGRLGSAVDGRKLSALVSCHEIVRPRVLPKLHSILPIRAIPET